MSFHNRLSMEPSAKLSVVLLFCRRALYGEGAEFMTTLNDFQQAHPVTVIRLYRPDPKDWFKDVMVYLHRVNDCRRRVEEIRSRAELLDGVTDPDEELTAYRDEVHQKLVRAEQDMKRVRVEVTELIGQLDSEAQRTVFTRRYVEWQSWGKIAWAMDLPVETVQMHHAKALPKLKCLMVKRGLIPDTYEPKKHKGECASVVLDGEGGIRTVDRSRYCVLLSGAAEHDELSGYRTERQSRSGTTVKPQSIV